MLRNEKGFTLLETLAALTILAVGVLTLVQMFSGSINQAAQAERYMNGVFLAQQKFSQLELDNFKSGTTEGAFENQEGYRWRLEVLPHESSLNNEGARIQIQKVSLRVYWEDRDQEKEVRLVTLNTLGEIHSATPAQLNPSSNRRSSTSTTGNNTQSSPFQSFEIENSQKPKIFNRSGSR